MNLQKLRRILYCRKMQKLYERYYLAGWWIPKWAHQYRQIQYDATDSTTWNTRVSRWSMRCARQGEATVQESVLLRVFDRLTLR